MSLEHFRTVFKNLLRKRSLSEVLFDLMTMAMAWEENLGKHKMVSAKYFLKKFVDLKLISKADLQEFIDDPEVQATFARKIGIRYGAQTRLDANSAQKFKTPFVVSVPVDNFANDNSLSRREMIDKFPIHLSSRGLEKAIKLQEEYPDFKCRDFLGSRAN